MMPHDQRMNLINMVLNFTRNNINGRKLNRNKNKSFNVSNSKKISDFDSNSDNNDSFYSFNNDSSNNSINKKSVTTATEMSSRNDFNCNENGKEIELTNYENGNEKLIFEIKKIKKINSEFNINNTNNINNSNCHSLKSGTFPIIKNDEAKLNCLNEIDGFFSESNINLLLNTDCNLRDILKEKEKNEFINKKQENKLNEYVPYNCYNVNSSLNPTLCSYSLNPLSISYSANSEKESTLYNSSSSLYDKLKTFFNKGDRRSSGISRACTNVGDSRKCSRDDSENINICIGKEDFFSDKNYVERQSKFTFLIILIVDREKEEYFKNPFSINFDTENYNFNSNKENSVMCYEESIKVEYEEMNIIF